MGRKIFVGNLSFDTTSADLEALFTQAGTCESASVITDRATGRSRGFGFVEMNSAGEAAKAIAAFNGHELHGRTLNVSEARERSAGGGGGGDPRGGGSGRPGPDPTAPPCPSERSPPHPRTRPSSCPVRD